MPKSLFLSSSTCSQQVKNFVCQALTNETKASFFGFYSHRGNGEGVPFTQHSLTARLWIQVGSSGHLDVLSEVALREVRKRPWLLCLLISVACIGPWWPVSGSQRQSLGTGAKCAGTCAHGGSSWSQCGLFLRLSGFSD